MNSFRASVIATEECHCRARFQRTLYTYVTSNESQAAERGTKSHLSCRLLLRFFASALTNARFVSSPPSPSRIDSVSPVGYLRFEADQKKYYRVIDARDKLDASLRQNRGGWRPASPSSQPNFERN